ncbi:MAG TPA: STAS domain-containing protein [Thiobacillaceae bacterium]|nr:STAS domain-containing protein [Thiobacillaceae bacterium]HNU63228.1 STAS domain-containing protein [Thiobacillaceae bacterium]
MQQDSRAELHLLDGVAFLEGDLTLAHATRMLEQCKAAMQQGVGTIDLSRVGHMDSSAISLILSLRRHAQARKQPVQIRSIPEDLLSLAKLYGVAEHL